MRSSKSNCYFTCTPSVPGVRGTVNNTGFGGTTKLLQLFVTDTLVGTNNDPPFFGNDLQFQIISIYYHILKYNLNH